MSTTLRRVRHNSEDSLPLAGINDDIRVSGRSRPSPTRIIRRKGRSRNSNDILTAACIIVSLFIGAILLVSKQVISHYSVRKQDHPFQLSSYPSLQYAFQNSKLVGLYFGAWCPMSAPATNLIERYLAESLLPPAHGSNHHPPLVRAPMSLVYVSSDRDHESFEKYQGTNWMAVPFESPERNDLKRHFHICSKYEAESLGIHPKMEIPTLLIFDAETQTLITENGLNDLEEYEDSAMDQWMGLHNILRAMKELHPAGEDKNYRDSIFHVKRGYGHHRDLFISLFT